MAKVIYIVIPLFGHSLIILEGRSSARAIQPRLHPGRCRALFGNDGVALGFEALARPREEQRLRPGFDAMGRPADKRLARDLAG